MGSCHIAESGVRGAEELEVHMVLGEGDPVIRTMNVEVLGLLGSLRVKACAPRTAQ